jgi:protein TonB
MISQAKDREPARMPTSIRVARQEPPPPRPPPPQPLAPPQAEESAAPEEPPPPQPKAPKKTPEPNKPPPEQAADSGDPVDTGAPVDLGTMMSNEGGEGPALNMAGPGEKVPAKGSKPQPEQPKPKKQPQACDEEPSKPVPVAKTSIGYPPEARAQGVEGQVVLRAFIDEKGRVENVVVVRSAGPLIDEPVAAGLKNWQFDPAVACGKRVKATFTIARRFELGG